jgi:hypothetical protein
MGVDESLLILVEKNNTTKGQNLLDNGLLCSLDERLP